MKTVTATYYSSVTLYNKDKLINRECFFIWNIRLKLIFYFKITKILKIELKNNFCFNWNWTYNTISVSLTIRLNLKRLIHKYAGYRTTHRSLSNNFRIAWIRLIIRCYLLKNANFILKLIVTLVFAFARLQLLYFGCILAFVTHARDNNHLVHAHFLHHNSCGCILAFLLAVIMIKNYVAISTIKIALAAN